MILAWHKAAPKHAALLHVWRDVPGLSGCGRVARSGAACGQPYDVIPLGAEFLSRFGDYAERGGYLSDGCVRVNRGADLYLNELARTIARYA